MVAYGKEPTYRYDQILSEEYSNVASSLLRRKKAVTAGEGLLVLDVQWHILQFLPGCAETLLHDVNLDDSTGQSSPMVIPDDVSPPWTWLGTEYHRSADSTLRALDLNQLNWLLGAKLDETNDHLGMLRISPTYFQN